MKKPNNHDDLEEVELLAAEMDIDDVIIKQTNDESIKNENKKDTFRSSFSEYSAKVNWKVFGAISLFTLGSWLDICGIDFIYFNLLLNLI